MRSMILRSIWLVPFLYIAYIGYGILQDESVEVQKTGLPQELDQFINSQQSLPRYVEADYSPLGRSPVVDALLGDPFYLPSYGLLVSEKLKEVSKKNSLYDLLTAVYTAGGIPILSNDKEGVIKNISSAPIAFTDRFGKDMGVRLYALWNRFIQISKNAETILSVLKNDEKQWLRENYDTFFFGEKKDKIYDFFSTPSPMPLKFFELASRIDLAGLADCARHLAQIVDHIYQDKAFFEGISVDDDFIWQEEGYLFIFSGLSHSIQTHSADFFLSNGNNNTYYTNAGGTEGIRPAALHVDLSGHHTYVGNNFVQGSGFLGVGLLATFEGNNTYKAASYSQAAGFFGTGVLMNLGGNNLYESFFGSQSCAIFGSSLLWNKGGNSKYVSIGGMTQASTSTLGVAFLVDNTGNNIYLAGINDKSDERYTGIAQGTSSGVRGEPWQGHPSFYGGISFLFNGGGTNKFQISQFGQGSGYFLGAGILVDEGEADEFFADLDSQGQGLHLSAGLLLKKGGGSHFKGGWGSIGVAGDRSVGMFINTGGNNVYEGTVQSEGTARKPKAIGLMIDLDGGNQYKFGGSSNVNIQKPRSPNEWPAAFFLSLGGNNSYSQNVDDLQRGTNRKWGIDDHGIGIDIDIKDPNFMKELFKKFPSSPRINFPFDPIKGWKENMSYRPLIKAKNENDVLELAQELLSADYDRRRQFYESIDLFRFTHPETTIDLSSLLKDPSTLPEDLFNFVALEQIQGNHGGNANEVVQALDRQSIPSAYARKIALKFVLKFGSANAAPALAKVMETDTSEENRAYAAYCLAKLGAPNTLKLLAPGLNSPLERIRFAAAAGLQESRVPGTLEALIPLLQDESFYVRRAAAMSAISLKYKEAIPVLLNTLQFDTLDTGENYGDNLYNTLAKYVGVNFGVNKENWLQWWSEVRDTFEFHSGQKSAGSQE